MNEATFYFFPFKIVWASIVSKFIEENFNFEKWATLYWIQHGEIQLTNLSMGPNLQVALLT